MSALCICTGCDIYDPLHRRTLHGDLWRVGEALVLNGCLDDDGDSRWTYGEPPKPGDRAIVLGEGPSFFERRGIVVISAGIALQGLADYVLPHDPMSAVAFNKAAYTAA